VDRAAAGGPFVYTGLPLSEAHAEFNLTAEQFVEVGAEIVGALDYYGVPEREQPELVEAYRASMSDVVTATVESRPPHRRRTTTNSDQSPVS
jgi:hypothetical protein